MKRNILNLAIACILGFGLVACSEDYDYTPAEKVDTASVVGFSPDAPSTVDADGAPLSVTLVRGSAEGSLNVKVKVVDPKGLFSVTNPNVSFAAGSKTANVEVSYNYDSLDLSQLVEVVIDEDTVSPYGISVLPLTVNKAWKNLGEGQFFDQLADEVYTVTVKQSPDGSLRWRMYGAYSYFVNDPDWAELQNGAPTNPIEFWVKDGTESQITWDKFWYIGVDYTPGSPIKAYLPSALNSSQAANDVNSKIIAGYESKLIQFAPYYYIDGLGGFDVIEAYLSLPGGPDLFSTLNLDPKDYIH